MVHLGHSKIQKTKQKCGNRRTENVTFQTHEKINYEKYFSLHNSILFLFPMSYRTFGSNGIQSPKKQTF